MMKKSQIKVLFLIHRINVGGAEQRLVDFLRCEMNNKTFLFEVLCLKEKGTVGEEINKLGVPVYILNEKKRIYKLLKLISFLKREKPDIIHLHLQPARFYTVIIKLFTRARLIYTIENEIKNKTRDEKIFEKIFYLLTDRIIAVSNSVKASYCREMGIKGNKISVIYNGVDISRFSDLNNGCFRKELALSAQNIIITTVARLVSFKGHIYLVRAAKILKEKYPYLRFIIVGDGDNKANIISEIKKLEVEDIFILTGHRRDIDNILSSTDIFVLPSVWYEGQPIALIEAMTAGKAIVTTNIEGVKEVVNGNAVLVSPENPLLLAKGIEGLVLNKDKRLLLGKEAKKWAESRFSLESMCKTYESLYYMYK